MTAPAKTDLYTRITNRIIAELEAGKRPWLQPWSAEHAKGRIVRPLRHNGLPYKQSQELGGQVRKGEKGELVVYADSISKTEVNAKGEEVERDIHFLKGYTVFNARQIDNLPAHLYAAPEPPVSSIQRIEQAEAYFKATGAVILHGGNRAFYAPGPDRIQMPPFETFRDAESYYAILAHECVHLSGHPSRLNRDLSGRFGSHAYAAEELIAELGSAFVCADLSLTPEVREDHAPYIANWLEVLRGDKRAIFTAASHAERAAAFLNGLQPQAAMSGIEGEMAA
jgi:antirestriction protein ArdC